MKPTIPMAREPLSEPRLVRERVAIGTGAIFDAWDAGVNLLNVHYASFTGDQLARTVRQSIDNATPWIITPAAENILLHVSELPRLCDLYATRFADQRIGLSDTAIIEEALRLRRSTAPSGRSTSGPRTRG
jgi:hypothetical protein